MTERKWLTCTEPQRMIDFIRNRASERKLRLFACACCRRVWHFLTPEGRAGVQVAERYADGLAGEAERRAAYEAAGGDWAAVYTQADCAPAKALADRDLLRSYCAADAAASVTQVADDRGDFLLPVPAEVSTAEDAAQCHLLRDLFGNPFRRPPALDPVLLAWNEGTATRIARLIYEERRFKDLPILADALIDAGCDDEVLLQHCRGPGPHVRGCWAVDLLLGKE
jgi:hypothetical protein